MWLWAPVSPILLIWLFKKKLGPVTTSSNIGVSIYDDVVRGPRFSHYINMTIYINNINVSILTMCFGALIFLHLSEPIPMDKRNLLAYSNSDFTWVTDGSDKIQELAAKRTTWSFHWNQRWIRNLLAYSNNNFTWVTDGSMPKKSWPQAASSNINVSILTMWYGAHIFVSVLTMCIGAHIFSQFINGIIQAKLRAPNISVSIYATPRGSLDKIC